MQTKKETKQTGTLTLGRSLGSKVRPETLSDEGCRRLLKAIFEGGHGED